jgi:NTP pyrophosphatase (non-canonical NTP hydrolase)
MSNLPMKPFTDLNFMTLRNANIERAKEWQTDEEFSPLFYAVATGGECGEALNVMKKLERNRIDAKSSSNIKPSTATLADLADEMAHTIIYMDLWAASVGIDLQKAIIKSFNAKSVEMGFKTKLEG